jgi:hypothetical protein
MTAWCCFLWGISTMTNILRLSSLIPAGLIVESTAEDEDVIVISARAGVKERVCPLCGKSSSRVHSQYVRTVSDLPCAGKKIELRLSHVGEDAIALTTGKSGHRREAIIPLYYELRAVLERIPRRSPVILTNTKKRAWTVNGLSSSFSDIKKLAWPKGVDLHFHDLRGTAATKFYLAGLTTREIAEIMAWEEDTVERIIRRYVGRGAAIKERIRRLNEAR